jgi:hypothetical protein
MVSTADRVRSSTPCAISIAVGITQSSADIADQCRSPTGPAAGDA